MKPSLFFYQDLLPHTSVQMVEEKNGIDDKNLVERIIAAYCQSSTEIVDAGGPIWDQIASKTQNLHDSLCSGDVPAVTEFLRFPHRSNLLYGFEMVFDEYSKAAADNPGIPALQAQWTHDNLVRLAETMGAVPVYLPEVDFQERMWEPEQLVSAIEQTVGFALQFPNTIPNEHGIPTSRGVISHRAVQALYQAWRLSQLRAFTKGGKTVEIGAGLGRTAWFASLFGLNDYTIVDLPMANVAQAYFLGRALGEDRVVLHGESDGNGPRVRIETPAWFHASKDRYDIAINNDSMVEIGVEAVEAYWQQLAIQSEVFVSMNHEAQSFRIADISNRLGQDVPTLRSLHPLRKGYVEEIFFFNKI